VPAREIKSTGRIRGAQNTDIISIEALLHDLSLPTDGVRDHLTNFLVLEIDGSIIGAVGLEIYGKNALLRSLAISRGFQGMGFGKKLYQAIIERAKNHHIQKIYLLTESAENYFAKRGFEKISRDKVQTQVKNSVEFTTACPESAICMKLNLT
jgi:amino-acid N-acetyltransferase